MLIIHGTEFLPGPQSPYLQHPDPIPNPKIFLIEAPVEARLLFWAPSTTTHLQSTFKDH